MMDVTLTENLIKLGMAILVGGIIGAKREFRDKAVGFRTIILITVGSTLFTIFSISMDPGFTQTRIAANIVTGIGFLGGGEIIFVWLSTLTVLFVLLIFPRLEIWIDHIRESRSYKIVVSAGNMEKLSVIENALAAYNLHVYEHHQSKIGDMFISTWHTMGKPGHHDQFVSNMLKEKDIQEFVY